MWSMDGHAWTSRRVFLSRGLASVGVGALAGLGVGTLASCAARKSAAEVVLYSSVDEPILRPIVAEFERSSGIAVRVVGDTEATKSTGLIERLLLEKDAPRADVWWSSEQLGVIELARAGVLEAMTPKVIAEFPGGWPGTLRDANGLWYGFALRARVIVYSAKRLAAADVPSTLGALLGERLRGRVGMANPAFGTTRVHLAALVAERGEEATRAWLEAMKAAGLKMYSGNSAVVRAVAQGEIDAGLTDTDDVHAGRANGWDVGMVFEEERPSLVGSHHIEFSGGGALVMPNTVARIRGGPHAANAARLVEYILSEGVERTLAASESKNTPVRGALLQDRPELRIDHGWHVAPVRLADSLPRAAKIARDVLGPG